MNATAPTRASERTKVLAIENPDVNGLWAASTAILGSRKATAD
jgi:hypothetical protein